MLKYFIAALIAYIGVSLLLAMNRLKKFEEYKIAMSGIPVNDQGNYKSPELLDKWTTIFFPATLFIIGLLVLGIIINKIIPD